MSQTLTPIPPVGFGLWKLPKAECAELVYQAIKLGYRHLDSASDYGNEVEVGLGIQRALNEGLCSREELWITSKLWNTYHATEHVQPAIEKSLQDLQLDYLDLYLIHFPIALKYVDFNTRYPAEWLYDPDANNPCMQRSGVPLHETWQGMETLVNQGLTRQIGVCNYNSALIHDLMAYAKIKPSMLQIEAHPFLTQEKLLKTCADYSIPVTAFSPFGALSYVELSMANSEDTVFDMPSIIAAAERLNKTPAQIVLRWGIQRGTAVIPKTSNTHFSIYD